MNRRRLVRRLGVALGLGLAAALLWRPVVASILGEENVTLAKQLAELMEIHDELVIASNAVQRGADVAENLYTLYHQAQAGVDELARYTTDQFLKDFRKDVYTTYPGFEILLEGSGSRRLQHWKGSRAKSPFTTYEMISAVFGDLTDPLKDKARRGQIEMDRATIWRYEAAGALALANDAEAWTKSADADATELYRLAADADAAQAQHLSARALSLIAVQNSHVIRLLSRKVRFDGIEGAMQWAERVRGANQREALGKELDAAAFERTRPPRMMRFSRSF